MIGPSGGNRHGGNGAQQQSKADGLADHAFSFVAVFADPVSRGHEPWGGSTQVDSTHNQYAQSTGFRQTNGVKKHGKRA